MFVSSTESAKLILSDGGGKFTKKYISSIAALLGGRSLLCASHEYHKFLRARLTNLFSATFLASFVPQFDQQILYALRTWETGSTILLLNQALKVNSFLFSFFNPTLNMCSFFNLVNMLFSKF